MQSKRKQQVAVLALAAIVVVGALQMAAGLPTGQQQVSGVSAQALTRLPRQEVSPGAERKPEVSQKKNSTTGGSQEKKNKNKKKLIAECLAAHNKLRRWHKVPDLQWDDKIAAFAQKRSNFIAKSDGDEFKHPPDLPYGENLFWHSTISFGCDAMVRGWYDEISLYDFDNPSFAAETGHFTQLIWRDTKRVGCATAQSSGPKGGLYLTCNYDPPGNFLGEFPENVPRVPTIAPTGAAPDSPKRKPPKAPLPPSSPAPNSARGVTAVGLPSTTAPTSAPSTGLVSVTATSSKPPTAANSTTKPKSKKKKKKKKTTNSKKDEEKKKNKNKKKKNKNKKKNKKQASNNNSTSTITSAPASTTTIKPVVVGANGN